MMREYTVALLLDHCHQKCTNNSTSAVIFVPSHNIITIAKCFSVNIFMCVPYYSLLAVPKIIATETTLNSRVGESFFLQCTVAGTPNPNITWMKDGIPLNKSILPILSLLRKPNSSRIVISKATGIEYNGMYTCIASNDAGSISSSFLIRLQGQQHDC